MDELGEITDYMYETASEDALIIRGLSQDENLNDNISVTIIATGFPANSIFTPYKHKKAKKVELLTVNNPVPPHVFTEKGDDVFSVHEKSSRSVISNVDDEIQGELEFSLDKIEEINELRTRRPLDDSEEKEKPDDTAESETYAENSEEGRPFKQDNEGKY